MQYPNTTHRPNVRKDPRKRPKRLLQISLDFDKKCANDMGVARILNGLLRCAANLRGFWATAFSARCARLLVFRAKVVFLLELAAYSILEVLDTPD